MSQRDPAAPPPDPLGLWRDWIDLAEQRWREAAPSAEDDGETELPERMLQAVFGLQSSMHRLAELYLSSLQLARREDVAELVERLDRLDRRLERLEHRLLESLGPGSGGNKKEKVPSSSDDGVGRARERDRKRKKKRKKTER